MSLTPRFWSRERCVVTLVKSGGSEYSEKSRNSTEIPSCKYNSKMSRSSQLKVDRISFESNHCGNPSSYYNPLRAERLPICFARSLSHHRPRFPVVIDESLLPGSQQRDDGLPLGECRPEEIRDWVSGWGSLREWKLENEFSRGRKESRLVRGKNKGLGSVPRGSRIVSKMFKWRQNEPKTLLRSWGGSPEAMVHPRNTLRVRADGDLTRDPDPDNLCHDAEANEYD